jgi:hypothetical protein
MERMSQPGMASAMPTLNCLSYQTHLLSNIRGSAFFISVAHQRTSKSLLNRAPLMSMMNTPAITNYIYPSLNTAAYALNPATAVNPMLSHAPQVTSTPMNEPIADVLFYPTGTPENSLGLDLDPWGNLWRRTLNGRERMGVLNTLGQYQLQNGQHGDIFESRNPREEGLLEVPLSNQPHPMIQALRNREKQRALAGSEIPRLRRIFNAWGLTGQGVKIGILDPYEPLEMDGVDLKTENGDPGQAWSISGHSRAISDIIKDSNWGIAPGAIVVDKGFVPRQDETLQPQDDISSARYNMTRTAISLFDDTSNQIDKRIPEAAKGLRVLSLTWGGSVLTTLNNLKETLNEQDESGEYVYPNTRRQILGWAMYQGEAAQDQAMLNFIVGIFQQPAVAQAHQRYIEATKRAARNGQIIVAAVGNEHAKMNPALQLPPGAEFDQLARSPYIISVAASDTRQTPGNRADDSIALFSSWGDNQMYNPTIAAPGQDIYVGMKRDTMSSNQVESGTSFAVPFVGGTIALMLQANPSLTFEQVKSLLQNTATRLPLYPVAAQGVGVINPEVAVQMAVGLKQVSV